MLQQTILVVSQNNNQLKVICDSLKKAGYQVLVADQGRDALRIIRSRRPDLALVDWKLSDLSTLSMIRTIRSDQDSQKLPIILCGRDMPKEGLVQGLDAGADLCLKEPIHPKEFIARLRAVLRRCYG